TMLRLALTHVGHPTHGSPVNFSGTLFNATAYHVREETGRIDYDEVREVAKKAKPRIIIGGGSAYARIVDFPALRSIADEVDAVLVVDMAHFAGLVAGGVYPSPVPHAQIVTTTTHKTLRGPRGGIILCQEAFAKEVDKQVFPGIQPGHGAGDCAESAGPAILDPFCRAPGERRGSRSEVRGHKGARRQRARRERASRVEAKPPHPQQARADEAQHQAMRGHGLPGVS